MMLRKTNPCIVDNPPKLSGGHITKDGIKFVVSFFYVYSLLHKD